MTSGLIYNLVEYLRTEFPAYSIFANTVEQLAGQDYVPNDYILVMETGGSEGQNYKLNIPTFEILSRAADTPTARKMIYDVYGKIDNTFGLILPSVIVDGVTYPQTATAQISAIQSPASLGKDENGNTQFSNNYQIYFDAENYI